MRNEEYFKKFIATIPNWPKEGIMFRDITPTLENGDAFCAVIDAMAEMVSKYDFNKIICADARGFLFGSALGYKLHKGVVPARKPGKLPRPGLRFSYSLEYGENILEISLDSFEKGDKVLIVDDLLATGGTTETIIKLVDITDWLW